MRLGTKIAVAFLLLSVLPLAGITLYSYQASISAFRKAVEAESGTLAEEMGGRMAALRRDLSTRVARLGSALREARKKGIHEMLVCIEEENRRHRGAVEPMDDATMLILKIGPS